MYYFSGFLQTPQNYSGHILCYLYTLCLCVLNHLQFEANSHSNYIWQFILQELIRKKRLGLHFLCSFSICNTGRAPAYKCWAHTASASLLFAATRWEGRDGQRLGRQGQQRGSWQPRRAPDWVPCWHLAPALRLPQHDESSSSWCYQARITDDASHSCHVHLYALLLGSFFSVLKILVWGKHIKVVW